MPNLTNPVKHTPANPVAWRKTWSDNRKPAAIADGAQGAAEANLTVQHDVKDQNDLKKFKAHVDKMEKDGKRKEMHAQNMPF